MACVHFVIEAHVKIRGQLFETYKYILLIDFFKLFKYSCLHFDSASHPQTYHLWLCPWILCTCSSMTLPLLSLSPLLSGNCQFVLYSNVSGCILLACTSTLFSGFSSHSFSPLIRPLPLFHLYKKWLVG